MTAGAPARAVGRQAETLLVTGGCGFIGSRFVLQAITSGARVVNLDALTYAGNPDNLSSIAGHAGYIFVHGSIMESDRVESLLHEHGVTAIVHFAAESHVDRSIDSPEPFIQTNVVGTQRLLDAARRYWRAAGSTIGDFRFLHVSTDEVYGSLEADAPAFTETHPYSPNSPYAASKAASDHLVRAAHHTYGLPVLITNCSNNYGPCQFPEKLIPLMIFTALAGKPLPIYGDGGNVRDWLYVDDHVEALLMVLRRGKLGRTYNIGGLNELSNLEVVRGICDLLDEIRPRTDGGTYFDLRTFVTDRPGHDRRYAMNCDRIGAELGWRPKHSFADGLRLTVEWYLENMPWRERILNDSYQLQRLGIDNVAAEGGAKGGKDG